MNAPAFAVQLQRFDSPKELTRVAIKIESMGFDKITVPDHIDSQLDPLILCTHIASSTSKITVGTAMINNQIRNPALIARSFGSLAGLYPGRMELGLGAGWKTEDCLATGMPVEPAGKRVDRLAEALQILEISRTTEVINFSGNYYNLQGLRMPKASGHFSIAVGGGGPRMLKLAARYADTVGVNPRLDSNLNTQQMVKELTIESHWEKIQTVKTEALSLDRPAPRIQLRTVVAEVRNDSIRRLTELAAPFGVDAATARTMPPVLVGTAGELAEKIMTVSAEIGIDEWIIHEDQFEQFSKVIEVVKGR
jgi:probable F420-dependent oxidoreductase